MSEQATITPPPAQPTVPAKRERITDKDPALKLARKRPSVLELAAELGSISKVCKQAGMNRTSFYEYKCRFQTHGLEGLRDLPPIHHSHLQITSQEVQQRLIELTLQNPKRGCNYLASLLAQEGIGVSLVTVQNILNKQGLGSRYERLLALEKQALSAEITLTTEQVKLIEQANPCFAECHEESSRPGQLLSQDTFYVGNFKGVGKLYLHKVVDTFGSLAFGVLGTSKQPEWAVSILYNEVLPFYEDKGIQVSALLTDSGREFCGREMQHPIELIFSMSDIDPRKTKDRTPRTNGFVERFHRTVLDEWLCFYIQERPHLGYCNMGKRPLDTLCAYLRQRQAQEGSAETKESILATAQASVRHEG